MKTGSIPYWTRIDTEFSVREMWFEEIINKHTLINYIIEKSKKIKTRKDIEETLHRFVSEILCGLYSKVNQACIVNKQTDHTKLNKVKQSYLYTLLKYPNIKLVEIIDNPKYRIPKESFNALKEEIRIKFNDWNDIWKFSELFVDRTRTKTHIPEGIANMHSNLIVKTLGIPEEYMTYWENLRVGWKWWWMTRETWYDMNTENITYWDMYAVEEILKKISTLQKNDDTVDVRYYKSENNVKMILVRIETLNGVTVNKTLISCNDPIQPRATYIINKSIDLIEKIKKDWESVSVSVNSIYGSIYDIYNTKEKGIENKIWRITCSKQANLSSKEKKDKTIKRIIDVIFNPHNALTNFDNTITDTMREQFISKLSYILLDNDESLFENLVKKETYSLYAHKINKELEWLDEEWSTELRLATEKQWYTSFLRLLKEPHIPFQWFKLKKEYLQYILLEGKKIPQPKEYYNILVWLLEFDTKNEQTLLDYIFDNEKLFLDKIKQYNNNKNNEYFLLESVQYTKKLLWSD